VEDGLTPLAKGRYGQSILSHSSSGSPVHRYCYHIFSICFQLIPFAVLSARIAQPTGASHPVCCSHASRLSAAEALRLQTLQPPPMMIVLIAPKLEFVIYE
jgi:hypothetical protein